MTVTTSVVICAYTERRWSQLVAAIASVRAQQQPAGEIALVIDHNQLLLRRARQQWPDLSVRPNAGPRGLSGARNTGIAHTTGEVVLFLDDDAEADPAWSARLTAPYTDPAVLGVGGSAVPVWEQAPPGWWPPEFGWVVGCTYRGQATTLSAVRNLMGCNMSVRRTVLEAVGGFDVDLGRTAIAPLGGEETELCIRARSLFPDGCFLLEPLALVHHWVPAERASWGYFLSRCRAEGMSKARIAARVGQGAALAAETAYVRRVLPSGVRDSLRRGLRGDWAAVVRAGAIVAGLAVTATGYLQIRWTRLAGPRRLAGPTLTPAQRVEVPSTGTARMTAEPVLPMVIDVAAPATPIDARRPGGSAYRSALCLLTRNGDPLARVRLDLPEPVLPATEVLARLAPKVEAEPIRPAAVRVAARAQRPGTSVVVATRDRPGLLRECIDSIMAGTVLPERLVVVDNAPSSDDTATLLAELGAAEPRLRYIREDRAGLARAHNAGLAAVTTPLVAFTDDDVVVDRRWLERLQAAFAADEQVGCVTGLIVPRELDTLPQQWVESNALFDKGLQRRIFDAGRHRPDDPLFPLTAGSLGSGANMSFRTEYLRRVGGFDDALGTGTVAMGGDDLAAFYDVITAGLRLVYEPAAIVLHRHHRDYVGLRRQTYGYGAGLGAYLTRTVLRNPSTALTFLRHAPATARRARRIFTPPALADLPPYPRELSREQWRGLASGPGRYLRSRRQAREAVL